MNPQARQAINDSIVRVGEVLEVNTRRGKSATGASYTAEDIVCYARAMALLAASLMLSVPDVAEELEKGGDALGSGPDG